MYWWGIAFLLWLAGFLIMVFNTFNIIVAEASPARAKPGWLPPKPLLPAFYKLLSVALICSSVAVLYFTETIDIKLIFVAVIGAALTFFASVLASTAAWLSLAKKYPDLYRQCNTKI